MSRVHRKFLSCFKSNVHRAIALCLAAVICLLVLAVIAQWVTATFVKGTAAQARVAASDTVPGLTRIDNQRYMLSTVDAPEGWVDYGSAQPRSDAMSKTGCDFDVNDDVAAHKTTLVKPVHCTITFDMVQRSKGKREQFNDDPAGWPKHNTRIVDDKGHKIFAWNRSHLVADQLGGEATPRNSITGTRFQNVGHGSGGMRKPEAETAAFIMAHRDCRVQYDATPVYITNEDKLPAGVQVDVLSCDGKLNRKYFIPNAQPGYAINYRTGELTKLENN